MNDAIRAIIIMSLTGGALTVLLLLAKPLIRHRLPKAAQYALWLVVVAALLVPVSSLVTLPAAVPTISEAVTQYVLAAEESSERERGASEAAFEQGGEYRVPTADDARSPQNMNGAAGIPLSLLFWLYLPVAAAVLLCYLASYWWYSLKLFRTRKSTDISAPVRVYKSAVAATPLLIGAFSPVIVLPERDYTDEQLRNVLAHELTHLRRKDIFVKWLSVIAVSVHWFNPIAWIMRREIDRACELACDEAVIRRYGASEKQGYGDTLIAVVAESRLPKTVLSTTMIEGKQALKERLGAIMKHRKTTRAAILVSAVLIAAAVFTACTLGAGSGGGISEAPKIEPANGVSGELADISTGLLSAAAPPAVLLSSAAAITEADAKAIALRHAGLNESDVTFIRVRRDREDGRNVYDVEFYSGNTEYDYEIDAANGKILEFDSDVERFTPATRTSRPSRTARPTPTASPGAAVTQTRRPSRTARPTASPNAPVTRTSRPGRTARPAPTVSPTAAAAITEADAKAIALRHAGLNESDVTYIRVKRDRDDGRVVYDVEFYSGRTEYEYEIDAADGRILEASQDRD
ncbi:MAG: PepSY domain-containing protein [Clostridiales bacterium]|jgi:beta-lactamase regulating signal transducer with metallopeptidase domain/uncharacterized membrane protein YkoI|nr:PepSY domain-containing protein [Clostridiales bacterium]